MVSRLLALLASALLALLLASKTGVSAQNALTLFVPAETTACLDAIPGPCVLVQQPELMNNTCARANIAQIVADISSTDESQARLVAVA